MSEPKTYAQIRHWRCSYCSGRDEIVAVDVNNYDTLQIKEQYNLSALTVTSPDRTIHICDKCLIRVFDILLGEPPDLTNQVMKIQYTDTSDIVNTYLDDGSGKLHDRHQGKDKMENV